MFRRPKPHKWIDAEIERLDPATDWAQIHRLMTTYRADDLMLDAVYVLTFPRFMVPAHGPVPVWRNGDDAKVVNRASKRADDTNWHNMIWWYHGPDHPETRRSVGTINKIHAHHAKTYPEAFLDHDDYLHPLVYTAAAMHKLRLQMGLPGYTEKEKGLIADDGVAVRSRAGSRQGSRPSEDGSSHTAIQRTSTCLTLPSPALT